MTAAEAEQQREAGEPLANAQHEAFAREVAGGSEKQDAYAKVFVHSSRKNAGPNGHRLANKDIVRARIAEMQAASASALTLTMQERREMLATCARTVEMQPRDLATVLRVDAELAGELIEKAALTVGPSDALLDFWQRLRSGAEVERVAQSVSVSR